MASGIHKLNARRVETLKEPGKYGDGGGLWLRIDQDKSKRWIFRWQRHKCCREMGLGSVATVSLAKAREAAATARAQVSDGLDPLEERKRLAEEMEKTTKTKASAKLKGKGKSVDANDQADSVSTTPLFRDYAKTYIATHETGWKNAKHRQQWRNTIMTHAVSILDKPVDTVTVDNVVAVLSPIWRTVPETASRLRGRIENILDAAKAAGHIKSPWENPARWKGNLIHLLPRGRKKTDVNHHPAMPFEDLPGFIQRLRSRAALSARALELTILCATRTNETLGATWSEFDLEAALWVIPKERMKMNVEHRVPLSERSVALLREIARGTNLRPDAYVFKGQKPGRPLSNMSMEMLLRRMDVGHYTVHGMRSSFRDYMGDMTDHSETIVEHALAHQVGDETQRAYRRGNAFMKRRRLMQDWQDYLMSAAKKQAPKRKSARTVRVDVADLPVAA